MQNHQRELADTLNSKQELKNRNNTSDYSDNQSYYTPDNSVSLTNRPINHPIQNPLNSVDPRVRKIAVQSLEDQDKLKEIARQDPDIEIRNIAINKITNQYDLGLIAEFSYPPERRERIMRKITDTNVLLCMAESASRSDIRDFAMNELEESYRAMKFLAKRKQAPEDTKISEELLKKFLEKIESLTKHTKDQEIRKRAISIIESQSKLKSLAKNDPDLEIRRVATINLEDQVTLGDLSISDQDLQIRQLATINIEDSDILKNLAEQEGIDVEIQRIAKYILEHQNKQVD